MQKNSVACIIAGGEFELVALEELEKGEHVTISYSGLHSESQVVVTVIQLPLTVVKFVHCAPAAKTTLTSIPFSWLCYACRGEGPHKPALHGKACWLAYLQGI